MPTAMEIPSAARIDQGAMMGSSWWTVGGSALRDLVEPSLGRVHRLEGAGGVGDALLERVELVPEPGGLLARRLQLVAKLTLAHGL